MTSPSDPDAFTAKLDALVQAGRGLQAVELCLAMGRTLPDLSGADFRGANLSRADLNGANLSGANFSGVNFAMPISAVLTSAGPISAMPP